MNYLEVYKRCIDFHRKYTDVRNDDSYWESVVAESEQIVKQFNNSKFVVGILATIILELERKSKEVKVGESNDR